MYIDVYVYPYVWNKVFYVYITKILLLGKH